MKLQRVVGLLALGGTAVLGYSLAEATWYRLRRVDVPVLRPGTPPLSVLHLSDAHFTAQQRRKVAWVQALARLRPDFVALTGDNFAFGDAMETALEALEPLLRFPGAFVFGSNDYYSAVRKNPLTYLAAFGGSPRTPPLRRPDLPTEAFRGVLTRAGWHDLNNARANVTLGQGGLTVDLTGLADPHLGWDKMPPPASHAAADLVIGLVHAPYRRAVQALVDDAARLVLAGHTHGGQVALPGLGALVSNTDLPLRYARGSHRWPDSDPQAPSYLEVTVGLGTSPYVPVRLAARPEAVLLRLVTS
ncbi:MAG: metallophosphoesterase [Bifidobacteriaceae bacterium]|jgi:predicted MPP superfamily phosphohydrolase|nr:metallophosphoesterase [Bifidobacteriaceae bacterium]